MGLQVEVVESKLGRFEGQDVKRYLIRRGDEFEVALISYGAGIQSVKIKDKTQKLVSVALGFDSAEEYMNSDLNPYFGTTVGRVANRISNAEFTLNGEKVKLDANSGKHCLHGGLTSTARANWASGVIDNGVKFSYVDAESKFPGEVWFECVYKVDPNSNTLSIEMKAITDKPTPINLTNHTYFNLAGEDSGEQIYDQELMFECDRYLDLDPVQTILTGKVNSVEGTKYDFREYRRLGDRIKKNATWPEEGFDNYFVRRNSAENKNEVSLLASLRNPKNGLKLEVWSNQLGCQFYTGNHLNVKKSSGKVYGIHSGLAIEAHNYPDSVNQPSFPSCILNVDQEYFNKTVYKFFTDN